VAESPESERDEVEEPRDTADDEVPAGEEAGTSSPKPAVGDCTGSRRHGGMRDAWKRRSG
jgi:hypothetical protein